MASWTHRGNVFNRGGKGWGICRRPGAKGGHMRRWKSVRCEVDSRGGDGGEAAGGGERGDAMGVARRVATGIGLPLVFLWALNQQPPVVGEEVNKSDVEWRSELTDMEYYVMRGRGTERSGSSPLDKEKRPGVYACRGCGVGLFSSEAKFNSGTGWPSFYDTLKDDQGKSRVQLTIQPLVRPEENLPREPCRIAKGRTQHCDRKHLILYFFFPSQLK